MSSRRRPINRISRAEAAVRRANQALGKNDSIILEDYLAPELIRALRKERKSLGEGLLRGETQPGYTTNEIDVSIDPRGAEYENEAYYLDPAYAIYPEPGEEAYAPVSFKGPLTESPTATSKPERPRTVAAAYDPNRSTLTLVFRDSTIYNYYDVSIDEWYEFRGLPSKWEYIRDNLDYKPRGPADVSAVPANIRMFAYRVTRAAQLSKGAKKK